MNIANEAAQAELLTRKGAASYLGVSVSTLATWACTGRYKLAYVKVGRLVKYRRKDLDAFIANGLVEGGATCN